MDAPPPRYRVVEQGRRLVVIDRWREGDATARQPGAAPAPGASLLGKASGFRRTRFDGGGVLVTRRWYDDRGPRTLTLGEGAATTFSRMRFGAIVAAMLLVLAAIWQPLLVAIAGMGALSLLNEEARAPVRTRVTRWLDRVAAR